MPEPFSASHHGCGGMRRLATTQPDHCGQPPVWAGLVFYQYPPPGEVWWAFACEEHRDQLEAPRPLNDRDIAELRLRRERHDRALAGNGWTPPQPLRRGPAARKLLDRARTQP